MTQHIDDGQLNALLDGELEHAEQSLVELHIATCERCRERLAEARGFLEQSGELLTALDGPRAARAPAPGADRPPVSRTAREPAVVVPPGATVREPALNIDGRTAHGTPSPFFPQAAERIDAHGRRREPAGKEPDAPEAAPARTRWRPDLAQLAWAASLVMALSVGFMANELYHTRRQMRLRTDLAAGTERTARTPADSAPAARAGRAAAPSSAEEAGRGVSGAPAARGTPGTGTRQAPAAARTPLRKPPAMRGDKPADTRTPTFPRERPPGAARAEDRALAAPRDAGLAGGIAANQPARAAGPPAGELASGAAPSAAAAAPTPGAAPTTPAAAPPAAARAAREADARLGAADAAQPPAFRRINADEAIRRMSGSIRLIDGLEPARIEVGSGTLVPGANPDRDVVRLHYVDAEGRRLVLDQQAGEAGGSVNGMMRGDTLITSAREGAMRIRWVDRKSFWLSLTGPLSPEDLRAVVERIR